MTTSRMLWLTGLVVTYAVAAGCGAAVPTNPTWVEDVRPIMVARCIRCHQSTPTNDPGLKTVAFGDFDHQNLSDFSASDLSFAMMSGKAITGKIPITSSPGNGIMPPPPAAKLADWQIETLQRWSNHPM